MATSDSVETPSVKRRDTNKDLISSLFLPYNYKLVQYRLSEADMKLNRH